MIPSAFVNDRLDRDDAPASATRKPPRVRAVAVALSLAALQCAAFGLEWGELWHAYVGRGPGIAPPHVLVYGGIAVMALCIAADVAFETLRLQRGGDADGSIAAFGFRAPRGVLLTAAGLITVALAAPFDHLWNGWYGVDASLWTPFHLMALAGMGIAIVGLTYACADLARAIPGFAFGVYLSLASGCGLFYLVAEPSLRTALRLGGDFATLLPAPLICALGMTFFALAGVAYARDSRAALGVLGLYLVRAALFASLAPLSTHVAVAREALIYRVPGFDPPLDARFVALSVVLLVPAFVIALARERALNWALAATGEALIALAACVWVAAAQAVVIPLAHADPPLALETVAFAVPATALAAAVLGALSAGSARGFGRLLRAP